jgi:3-keto-5-aminohexanoate cleavage enzyme
MEKLIINAALTGNVPTKADNPHIPLTPPEIAADARRCHKAGAAIVHLHARDENGRPAYQASIYQEIIAAIKNNCPDLIICVSTSGRVFTAFQERAEVLDLDGECKPEMASLTLGSMNFPGQASVNAPEMIRQLAEKMLLKGIVPELEIFDLGMLDYAKHLICKKILREPLYFNLFLGSLGTLGATPLHLALMVHALPSGCTWSGAGIGRHQFFINSMAITMGGHVRVGLEDNLYYDTDKRRHATNPDLVERLANMARVAGREIASPAEARAIIGLKPHRP